MTANAGEVDPVIGIIGGTGIMGNIFKNFFKNNGFEVMTASRSTKLSIGECVQKSDIVVISVPIDKTVEVIKNVAPLVKQSALMMDLTSLKKKPVETMLEYSKSSVAGVHPMFGPGVKDLKNQTIVLCPARGEKWFAWIKKIFEKNGARVRVSSAEDHDRMMAVIQGLLHFISVSFITTLKDLGIDAEESLDFASPFYSMFLTMAARILNQDPELYAGIQILNPLTPEVLKPFLKNNEKLYKSIIKKDRAGFTKLFREASGHLGKFKTSAVRESGRIIEAVLNRRKTPPV